MPVTTIRFARSPACAPGSRTSPPRSWRAMARPDREGPVFELRASIAARELVYLRFDADRTGNVGRAVAQMALLDLGAAASELMDRGVGTFVCVDEYGALEASPGAPLRPRPLRRLLGRPRHPDPRRPLGRRARGPRADRRHRLGARLPPDRRAGRRRVDRAARRHRADLADDDPHRGLRPTHRGGDPDPWLPLRGQSSELQRLGPGEAWVARLDRSDARRARRVRVVPAWRASGAAPR